MQRLKPKVATAAKELYREGRELQSGRRALHTTDSAFRGFLHCATVVHSGRAGQRDQTPRGDMVEEHARKPGVSALSVADEEICEPLWLTSVERGASACAENHAMAHIPTPR